ncbi:hypothetical protein BpHYR1_030901 [Brachionus plicatilis]|uniref:Uncharacterized protein n=1 Tax=Brachionus plicatilis TaxID=10195 RepID=A0A3M7RNT2_BRAPC|nr:hypothetical protein BpHYR1_030901 [Brachionus plicatilis]
MKFRISNEVRSAIILKKVMKLFFIKNYVYENFQSIVIQAVPKARIRKSGTEYYKAKTPTFDPD